MIRTPQVGPDTPRLFKLVAPAAFLFCLIALLPVCALSQAPASGARFTGTVEDPSGARIVAATVVLDTGTPEQRSTETDASGTFVFRNVRTGAHTLQVRQTGFKFFSDRIVVPSQQTTAFQVVLSIAATQEITVSGEADQLSTESSENQNSNSLDSKSLAALPLLDNDYIATMSLFLDSSALGTSGVAVVVDGMEVRDGAVPASTIKEIKVNQDPYSAEYSRPGRGRIEIVTKAPEPRYHGTFNFALRDSALNARDYFAETRAPEQRRSYEGYFTGPIRGSKSTFFTVSVEHNADDVQSAVDAFLPGNVNLKENVQSPGRYLRGAVRVEHYLREDSSVSFQYSYRDGSKRNQRVGGFVLPEAGANNDVRTDEAVIKARHMLTPKLLNQFTLYVGHAADVTTSINDAPAIVIPDYFTGGGAQADVSKTELYFAGSDTVSYANGRHMIKAGVSVPDLTRRGNNDFTKKLGVFTFDTLADYPNNPSRFVQQQGDGRLRFTEKVVSGYVQDDIRVRPELMISLGLRYDWQNLIGGNNNFAPRLSFAFSPKRLQKTVVRGGAGIFYDRTGPAPVADLLQYDGQRLIKYVIQNVPGYAIGYPDAFLNGIPLPPPSVIRLAPGTRLPYMLQSSIGIEQQVARKTMLTVTYSNSRSIDLFRSLYYPSQTLDPAFGVIRQIESKGRQTSNALEVQMRGSVTRYFTGQAQYRLSSAQNNTSGIGYAPADPYNPGADWGRADWDRRHTVTLLGSFDPGRLLKLGVTLQASSGQPYTEVLGTDANDNSVNNDRPLGVGRNTLQGADSVKLDLRWSRDFHLLSGKEKSPTATLALDAFNVLNITNYTSYVGNLGAGQRFGEPSASAPARRLQLGVRLAF